MKNAKPFLLITGFLGAGKTTLLKRLLHELNPRNIQADVILNDFSNADIDVLLLTLHCFPAWNHWLRVVHVVKVLMNWFNFVEKQVKEKGIYY